MAYEPIGIFDQNVQLVERSGVAVECSSLECSRVAACVYPEVATGSKALPPCLLDLKSEICDYPRMMVDA